MKHFYIFIVITILTNCQTATKKQVINKNTSEYKAFAQQEHRFELNGCELKYNDKPFKLGMTLQEFEKIFGNEWDKESNISNKEEPYFMYNKQNGLEIVIEDNKLRYI